MERIKLQRQLVLRGGNIETISNLNSAPSDLINSSADAVLIPFDHTVDNYFFTTQKLGSGGDSIIQSNYKMTY